MKHFFKTFASLPLGDFALKKISYVSPISVNLNTNQNPKPKPQDLFSYKFLHFVSNLYFESFITGKFGGIV